MTREIKFRFWDKDLKKLFYRKPAHNDFSHPKIVPQQFTGLKDKNGQDIYEGDILIVPGGAWGVVVWKSPFFEVTISATESSLYSREWLQECEVFGNQWDNPELIKQS